MSITLSALQKQRRDTAANWTGANPILLAGEIGIESDTNKIKIGDGSTAWTSLGYRPWSQVSAYPLVNADIAAAAAIAYSKLATLTSGNVVLGSSANVATSTAITGDVTISNTGVTAIASGVIVNADINASAGIVDTKLATIATAGKVSNSATTAASANTASAIVARDASGNFTAGTITAALTGNASSATTAAACTGNATTVTTNANLTGDVTSTGNATAIAAGVIVNADVNASAAIAGTKIAPDFGAQTITTTGVISPALGTAALPGIAFTGDLDSGVFSSGANAVDITTGGTRRFGVSSAGDLTAYGGNLTLNAQGDLRFADSDSSNYIAIQAPATVTSNLTFTLPSVDGTNGQVLSTNGTGTLSFIAANSASNLGDGTAATPAVNFSSDTDTGVFRAGANRLAFATNGASVGEFDGSNLKFNSGYGSVATAYGCRAWVNFNGTGTVAIRASGNVSSITDNGTGDYTVNFTTALVDANYSAVAISTEAQTRVSNSIAPTTTTLNVQFLNGSSNSSDATHVSVAIFR